MTFDADEYAEYRDLLRSAGINIPIIPGVRPVACMEHVLAAEDRFGASIPASLKKSLECAGAEKANEVCQDFTMALIYELRKIGAPGVHMFTLNDVEMIKEIIEAL
jgi:methylenetetrahydrofolate reductase (NADPH)